MNVRMMTSKQGEGHTFWVYFCVFNRELRIVGGPTNGFVVVVFLGVSENPFLLLKSLTLRHCRPLGLGGPLYAY